MNSDEEKALFEQFGWEYDFIERRWANPTKQYFVTNDALVEYNKSRESELELRQFIVTFGKKNG